MSEPQLSFNTLAQRLQGSTLPIAEPAPDLWPRIVERHARARQRARRRRALAAGAALVLLLAVFVGAVLRARHTDGEIDWQARAQALELRLHAVEPGAAAAAATDTEEQLAQLDALLQAAYDNGADHSEVVALWKRRSELLDVLLRVRQRNFDTNRT